MKKYTHAEVVENVLMYLENHKQEVVERLFPGQNRTGYHQEWLERDTVKFWQHLDAGNRDELVKMANEHYEPFVRVTEVYKSPFIGVPWTVKTEK